MATTVDDVPEYELHEEVVLIWPEHARRGGRGWRIVDELTPHDDELVIQKVRYDAFYGTHLDPLPPALGIDTVVVCGTVANICVH